MSQGEEKVAHLLLRSKYRFEREKRFTDLKGGRYRFDFYVYSGRPTPCIIEVNGEQHYQKVGKYQRTRREFEQQRERDRQKISYCLSHNIPIYCIPYWELDNIRCAADLFQEKFRATSRWKNDLDRKKFHS